MYVCECCEYVYCLCVYSGSIFDVFGVDGGGGYHFFRSFSLSLARSLSYSYSIVKKETLIESC